MWPRSNCATQPEYILKRTEEVGQLKGYRGLQGSRQQGKVGIIIKELQAVAKQYGQLRCTMLLYSDELRSTGREEIPDYPVHCFCDGLSRRSRRSRCA
ncbi:MAG: hypothetical protein ACLS8R_02795 [Anaeromassilibacillus sp.]